MGRTDPATPRQQATEFLEAVWPEGIPKGSRLLIWTLPDKRSAYFAKLDEAVGYALMRADEESDVYVGVGLRREGLGPRSRGGSADVTWLPGVVADVDVAGPGHKKENLFDTREKALEFVERSKPRASIVVWSGGGAQAWWLFDGGPIHIADDVSREDAESVSRGWGERLRKRAARLKRDVDSVWDLSRVLRLPGTLNCKEEDPRPVELLSVSSSRAAYGELPRVAVAQGARRRTGDNSIVIRGDAEPELGMFQQLADIDPRFTETWERRRKDLQDQSASGHDMALASFAAAAGWTDQEIVDLLVAHRRKHGDDLKLREDYYARTIARAQRGNEAAETLDRIDETDPTDDEGRRKILRLMEHTTGAPVDRILRYVAGDREEYVVVTRDGGEHLVGGIDDLARWKSWWAIAFRCRIVGCPSQEPKRAKWLKIVSSIHPIVEDVDARDASPSERARAWLIEYLAGATDLSDADSREQAEWIRASRPFDDNGFHYISLEAFLDWVRRVKRERLSPVRLATLVQGVGLKKVGIKRQEGPGRQVFRRYWTISAASLESEEIADGS